MSNTDPLAAIRAQLAGSSGSAPAPQPEAITGVGKSEVDGTSLLETLWQRVRYFENLVEHLFAHQKTLTAQVQRTGTAPAAMPHFASLKSAAGDYDPNGR